MKIDIQEISPDKFQVRFRNPVKGGVPKRPGKIFIRDPIKKLTSQKEAWVRWANDYARELIESSANSSADRTIDAAIKYYLNTPRYLNLSVGTHRRYRQFIESFAEWCAIAGIRTVKHFTRTSAQRFQRYYWNPLIADAKREHPGPHHSPKGTNCCINAVDQIFIAEIKREDAQIEVSPFLHIEPMPVLHQKPRFWADEEYAAIISACRALGRHEHWVSILYYTAMRTAELRYMEVGWVAKDFSQIDIPQASSIMKPLTRGGHLGPSAVPRFVAKDKQARSVPIHPALIEHLQYYLAISRGRVFLVDGDFVVSPNYFYNALRDTIIPQAKRMYPHLSLSDLNVHQIRKTSGSHMRKNGARLEDISEILGHSSIELTRKTYAMVDVSNLREAVNFLPGKVDMKVDISTRQNQLTI